MHSIVSLKRLIFSTFVSFLFSFPPHMTILAHLQLFPMWVLSASYLQAPWTGDSPISFLERQPPHSIVHISLSLGFNKSWGTQAFCMCDCVFPQVSGTLGGSYLTLQGSLYKCASSHRDGGRDVYLASAAFNGLCLALEQLMVAERLDEQLLLKCTDLHLVKSLLLSINTECNLKAISRQSLWWWTPFWLTRPRFSIVMGFYFYLFLHFKLFKKYIIFLVKKTCNS